MAVTTAAAIRDRMRTTVRALVPASLAHVPFRAFDERVEFRGWCDENKIAAFRWFSIRDVGPLSPPEITNTDVEEVVTSFVVECAYPLDYRYGHQLFMDLADVRELDMRKIEHAIGTNGYASLDVTTGGDATVTTDSTTWERSPVCEFGVLTLTVRYKRSMS